MATAKRKAKPVDPISDRARALNDQIAALESEIKKLDTQIQHTTTPRL
jgi:outer membrane murein-binding lipoprotein Lpp